MEDLKCIGCGAIIQSEDKNKIGYLPLSVLEKNEEGNVYCQRCFRLKHYNEVTDVAMDNSDYLKILQKIEKEDALIIKIVDVFDFEGSWINGILRHVNNTDIILLANKIDLLPKNIKPSKIIHWLKFMSASYGLKPIDVLVMSALKGHHLDHIIESINSYRKGRNVYVVGSTNTGKSTFINALIKRYTDISEDLITVSHFPGTTLDMIEIPLDDKSFIIDTPGIINTHQYAHYLSKDSLKLIMPKKPIKPKVFQLNDNQTLFIGGLARVDFIKGEKTSFICHFSPLLNIHRTKLEKADELYNNRIGDLLTPPSLEELEKLPKYTRHTFTTSKRKTDLVISGLGFITILGKTSISVYAPKGVGVMIREAII